MKKIFFASAFSVITLMAAAQSRPEHKPVAPEQIARRQANALSERLSLTEAQRSKAYSVYLDQAKKRQEVMAARRKEMEKRRLQDEAARKLKDQKIEQVLTADQKKTFQQFAARRENFRFGFEGRRFDDRFNPENRMAGRFKRFRERPDGFDRRGDFNDRPERENWNNGMDRNRPDDQPGQNQNRRPRRLNPDMQQNKSASDSSRVSSPNASPESGS